MREIKFRAWNLESKRWIEDWSISSYDRILDLNAEMHDGHLIVCQYTGIHDKSGKEIYEGDICVEDRGERYEQIGQIFFGCGGEGEPADYVGSYYGWCFGSGNPDIDETTGFLGGELEVIGNIYENPELLEKVNG